MSGGRTTEVVRATQRLHTAITQPEITIDAGSGPLLRHLMNARRRVTSQGVQISKENPLSPRKIDAAVAAILAYAARSEAITAGYGRPRKRRASGF